MLESESNKEDKSQRKSIADLVVVDEPYRKQGIAAEVMKYVESYAQNNKLTSIVAPFV